MIDQIAIGAGILGCLVGLVYTYKAGHRWWIQPGQVRPRGQFDREKRYCCHGPNGLPLALTDDAVFAAELEYRKVATAIAKEKAK
jgi:hypothetical protein